MLQHCIKQQNNDALRDLVPFVQFKKREKNPWKSVPFSKVSGFRLQLDTNSNTPACTNGTKLRNTSHIINLIPKANTHLYSLRIDKT